MKGMKARKRVVLGVTMAIFALGLVACAPHTAVPETGAGEAGTTASAPDAEQEAITVDWSMDSDCGTCHTKQAESQTDGACLASKHAANDCVQCHSDESTLSGVHEGATATATMPSTLKKTSVDTEATCESCHNPAELATKTADCTVLTDDEGTVVNPHDLPSNADHEEVNCISCHKLHSSTGIEKTAQRACSSCHHAGVYACGTCHAA